MRRSGAEFGANDFVISVTGSGLYFDDLAPAVAMAHPLWGYYLVVWQATDVAGPGVQEFEIKGRAISAWDCEPDGPGFYVSDMGQRVSGHDAYSPDVVYNPDVDEYLIVWVGDDDSGDLANDEFEIFGQRIDGLFLWEVGINDFRISDMGPDGDRSYSALEPAVAYDTSISKYLVVWDGDDDTGGMLDQELEVFAQLLTGADGTAVGPWNFRISDMGPDGDINFAGRSPATIAGGANRFLVVWDGTDDSGLLVENEWEVFGQLLAGNSTHELLISLAGAGEGLVTSEPSGIDCGNDCAQEYDEGTVVTLTPIPEGDSLFGGWSGDPDCTDGQVTMTSAMTCTARFDQLGILSDGFESGDTSAWSDAAP